MGTGLRAYDNSYSRSMALLLPMKSRQLNMSLLAFSDTVSDRILAIAVFPTGEKVFQSPSLVEMVCVVCVSVTEGA